MQANHIVPSLNTPRTAASGTDAHFFPVLPMHAGVGFDVITFEFDLAPNNGPVLLGDFPTFELPAKPVVHLVILGDDQHAAGVAVEPMHDPRASRPAGGAEPAGEMKLQGGGQGAPAGATDAGHAARRGTPGGSGEQPY